MEGASRVLGVTHSDRRGRPTLFELERRMRCVHRFGERSARRLGGRVWRGREARDPDRVCPHMDLCCIRVVCLSCDGACVHRLRCCPCMCECDARVRLLRAGVPPAPGPGLAHYV